jgi:hypothetical protein
LNKLLAFQIYQCKLSSESKPAAMKGWSAEVGRWFDVNAKTVRDVWNRRTWAHATRPLWSSAEVYLLIIQE